MSIFKKCNAILTRVIIAALMLCALDGSMYAQTLECHGYVNAAAGMNCNFDLTAQDLLMTDITGRTGFEITIGEAVGFDTLVLDSSFVGQELQYIVTDTALDISCSDTILFYDSTVPQLECSKDTVACENSILPDSIGFPIPSEFNSVIVAINDSCFTVSGWDACGRPVQLCFQDSFMSLICDINFCSVIYRTWTVTDPNIGPNRPNTAICIDSIYLGLPDRTKFQFLDDFLLLDNEISNKDLNNNGILDGVEDIWPPQSLTNPIAGNGILDVDEVQLIGVTNSSSPVVYAGYTREDIPLPEVTGYPNGIFCHEPALVESCVLSDWKDRIIESPCARFVERTWKLRGWCSNQDLDVDFIQKIVIANEDYPLVVNCPTNYDSLLQPLIEFLKPDNEIPCNDLNINGILDREEDIYPSGGNDTIDRDENQLQGITTEFTEKVLLGETVVGIPDPSVTGSPLDMDCSQGLLVDWKDQKIDGPCSKFIERTWMIRGLCDNQDFDTTFVQRIKIVDDEGPIITNCPDPDTIYFSNPNLRTFPVPKPSAYDDCDEGQFAKGYTISAISDIDTIVVISDVFFYLSIDSSEIDTLSVHPIDVDITWTLDDRCGNKSYCLSTVTLILLDIELPVEIVDFRGSRMTTGILLDWSTASEINNKGFEIQRSSDGRAWERIGFVNGSGNSSVVREYSFLDENPEAGINHYRLKQIDYSGEYEYSEIVLVDYNVESTIHLYPNPTSGELLIEGIDQGNISIINNLGITVKETELKNNSIDLGDLPNGLYFIRIKSSEFSVIKSVIKN